MCVCAEQSTSTAIRTRWVLGGEHREVGRDFARLQSETVFKTFAWMMGVCVEKGMTNRLLAAAASRTPLFPYAVAKTGRGRYPNLYCLSSSGGNRLVQYWNPSDARDIQLGTSLRPHVGESGLRGEGIRTFCPFHLRPGGTGFGFIAFRV